MYIEIKEKPYQCACGQELEVCPPCPYCGQEIKPWLTKREVKEVLEAVRRGEKVEIIELEGGVLALKSTTIIPQRQKPVAELEPTGEELLLEKEAKLNPTDEDGELYFKPTEEELRVVPELVKSVKGKGGKLKSTKPQQIKKPPTKTGFPAPKQKVKIVAPQEPEPDPEPPEEEL